MRTDIIPPLPDSIDEFLHLPLDTEDDEVDVQRLINRFHLEDPLTASEYLEIDSALQIEDQLDDDAIISLVQGEEAVEEEEEALETTTAKPTPAEAVKLIDKLMDFLMDDEAQVDVSNQFFSELKGMKKTLCRIVIDSKCQTDITSFLEPIN